MHSPRTAALRRRLPNFSPAAHGTLERAAEDHQPAVPGGADSAGWLEGASQQHQAAYLASLSSAAGASGLQANPSATDPYHHVNLNGEATLRPEHSLAAGQSAASRHTHVPLGSITFHATPSHLAPVNTSTKPRTQQAHASQAVSGSGAASPFSYNQPQQLAPHLAPQPQYRLGESAHGRGHQRQPSASSAEPGCYSPLSRSISHTSTVTSASTTSTDAYARQKVPPGLPPVQVPMLDCSEYEDVVHNVVWEVGRAYGFQAFNLQPDTGGYKRKQYVPATIFVASDHLVNLLVRNMMLRVGGGAAAKAKEIAMEGAAGGDAAAAATVDGGSQQVGGNGSKPLETRFALAVLELHSHIFASYEGQWCDKVHLPARPEKYTAVLSQEYCHPAVVQGLLAELAVYFLLYSEGVNMRHMPEGLWFFYWLMVHSPEMERFWAETETTEALPSGSGTVPTAVPPPSQGTRDKRVAMRNLLQAEIAAAQASLRHDPSAPTVRPTACAAVLAGLPGSLPTGRLRGAEASMYLDLVAYGDGGFFCDRVVTPVFYVLSFEMDHMFQAGQEEAFRLGYDDCNESLCCRPIVKAALSDLGVTKAAIKAGEAHGGFTALTCLGCAGYVLGAECGGCESLVADVWEDSAVTAANGGEEGSEGAAGVAPGGASAFDAQRAALWWSQRVFVKTYKERRTFLAVYRTFYRVFSFHFTLMHILAAYAWSPMNLKLLSTAVITHSIFSALERYANWYMTRARPDPLFNIHNKSGWVDGHEGDDKKAAAKKRKGSGGSGDAEVGSGAGFSGLGDREAMAERHKRRQAFREEEAPLWGVFGWIEWVIVAIALTAFFVLQYIGPMTEMAKAYWLYAAGGYTAMVLGHGVITTRDGYCVSLSSALRLPSYFRAHSARPSATYWLARDMKIGWGAWWLTVLFWVQTLALKIVFDYFIIVKPMKGPIEMILQRDWLPCKTDYYQVMGTKLPIPCFDGDWVLVVIRVVPFILVMLVDSQIFYQITTVMWGIMRGLLRLDLGTVSDWASLRAEFHRGPMRWWSKCMSSAGNRNNRAAIALRRAGVPIAADFRSVSADLPIIGTAPSGASSAGLALDPAATGSSELGPDGNPLVSGPAGTYSHIAQSLAGLYPQITVTAKAVSGSGDAEGDDDHAEGDDVDVEDADGADGADSKKGKKDKRAKDKKGGSKDKKRASGGKATGDNAGKRGLADMRMMLLGTSDESLAMWDAFATAWDEVVADLRSADLVSDKEYDYLVFTRLNYSPGLRATGVRPLLLPAFFYAGQVQRVVDTGLASSSQALVLAELRSLLVWLGCTLGLLNPTSAQVILEAAWSCEVVDLNHSQARDKGLKGAVKLLEAMQEVAACVNTPQDAARRRAAHKDAVAAIADILRFLEVEARAVIHFAKKRGGSAAKRRRAAAADKKAKAKRSDDGCGGADGVDVHEEGEEGAFDMATHAPGEPLPPPEDDIEASERLLHVVAQLREALVYDPAGTAAALSNLHARADGGETSSQASAATGATNATQQWGSTLGPSASVASGLTTMTCMTGASGVAGQRGKSVVAKVIGVAHRMLTLSGAGCQPRGAEAQRILSFFMTSLANRQLEKPPSVDEMLSWTVLTPVYEEDVLYPLDARQVAQQLGLPTANASKAMVDLLTETEDSVSLMAYLRSVFPKDWDNFKERLGQQLNRDLREVTELDFAQGGSLHAHALALQLWASYRGQLLARTVRGMMCYERALRVLVQLEYPRPPGVDEKSYVAWVDKLVSSKFSYVVSVQVYGRCRNAKDLRSRWLAESVDILLGTFPKLKAAFLDSAPTSAGPAGFSVLIRGRLGQGAEWDSPELAACHPRVEEVYRVRLPANRYSGRNVIVGEGKPENQNHAVIFAHGEGLQTIDMNQDNALAEALKMRNLLGELRPDTSVSRASRRAATKLEDTAAAAAADPSAVPGAEFKKRLAAARATERPTALVGFREWIFSDVSGALGSFAACAEYTFGTLVQRTMSQPAHVRLHYGHPDLFNKVYTMTKGGVSKATRQLHISEDVFGGLNHNLRGGRVKYKEYISVGKGRDMGLDSINAFEIKISGGCGEIFLSRDMYRMASRLDFFRLLHLYFSAAGHYINNWLVMSSVYAQILSLCIFAFAQASTIVKPEYFPTSEDDPAPPLVKSYVFQDTIQLEYVLQLGMLSLIPFVAELALEYGFVKAVLTMVTHIVTGSFAFFVFKQQTTGFYFLDSLIYGGAQYIGTGRGFSITSSSFVKLFTNYGRSHLYLGFELAFLAIVFAIANDCVDCSYAGLTWGTWLAAVSLVFSPFWFNPLTFSTSKVKRDLRAFSRWLNGEVDPDTNVTWHAWNTKQLAKVRNDRGTQTDHYMNVFWGLITQCAPLALLALATVSRLTLKVDLAPAPFGSSYVVFLLATIIIWAVMWLVLSSAARFRNAADRRGWRLFSFWGIAVGITFVVVYLAVLTRYYEGSGIINLLLILYANLNILLAVHRAAAHLATRSPRSRAFVDAGYKAMDLGIGYIVLGIMGLLSLIGIVARVQTTLLFNVTFARSVRRGSIVRTIGGRKADGASAQLTSLMDDNSSVRSSPGTPVLTSNRGANGGGGGGRRRGGSGAQQPALGGAAAAGRGAALAGISGSVARV